MELQEWKAEVVKKAISQITYRNNMSSSDISELTFVLSDYLDEGISVLKKWRKLKNDNEFLNREHDDGLIDYLKNKMQANGRDLFSDYSSGGVRAKMDKTPESVLKSTCKQVM